MSSIDELAARFDALPLEEQLSLLAKHRSMMQREVPEVLEVYLAAREVEKLRKQAKRERSRVISEIRGALRRRMQASKQHAQEDARLRAALDKAIAAARRPLRPVLVIWSDETCEQLELVA